MFLCIVLVTRVLFGDMCLWLMRCYLQMTPLMQNIGTSVREGRMRHSQKVVKRLGYDRTTTLYQNLIAAMGFAGKVAVHHHHVCMLSFTFYISNIPSSRCFL